MPTKQPAHTVRPGDHIEFSWDHGDVENGPDLTTVVEAVVSVGKTDKGRLVF